MNYINTVSVFFFSSKFVVFIIYHVLAILLRIYSWGYRLRTKCTLICTCTPTKQTFYTHFPLLPRRKKKRKMNHISTQQRNVKIYYLLLYRRWTCTALMAIVRELWKCVVMMIHVHEKFIVTKMLIRASAPYILRYVLYRYACVHLSNFILMFKKIWQCITIYFVGKTTTASILETGISTSSYLEVAVNSLGSCVLGAAGSLLLTWGKYTHALSFSRCSST